MHKSERKEISWQNSRDDILTEIVSFLFVCIVRYIDGGIDEV